MKEIQTKSGKILVVEVPEEAYSIKFIPTGDLVYKVKDEPYQSLVNVMKACTSIRCELIGKLSELTDKDCEEFVEKHPNIKYRDYMASTLSKAINGWTVNWIQNSAKESFTSLLKSEGIDTSKEHLIIKVL